MLSWEHLAYGAGLSAFLETGLMLAVPRWRRPGLIVLTAVIGFLAPFSWQALLKVIHATEFYHDFPLALFPISWQDVGSGVITYGVRSFVLSYGPMRRNPARDVADLSIAVGAIALLVDIYLY